MALEKIRPRVVDESGNYTFNNVTATGNLVTLNANLGNVATANYIKTNNLQYANGVSWPIGGAVTASGSNTHVQFNNAGSLGSSANFIFDSSTNRLTVDNITANGAALTNLTGANISGSVGNANFAAYAGNITIAAQSNITSVGTLTSLDVTGNISSGNANLGNFVIANFFSGSGNNLSNIQASNITGAVAYATTANSVAGANVSGAVTYAATANAVAGANVLGEVSYATTANSVAGANVTGAVSFATTANSVAGANVSGAVGLATFATTANAVAGANVSGQVANALVAGTVYTNAQPNITSVGTLSSLTVTGNISGANVSITDTTASTSKTTGALTVAGGVGISNDLTVGNSITVNNGSYGNVVITQFASIFATGSGPNPRAIYQATAADGVAGIGIQAYSGLNGQIYSNTGFTFTTGATIRDKDFPTGGTTRATVDSTGLAVTGNITSTNANLGNLVIANYFSGSGNNLSNIQGSNVTGEVGLATYATTANSVAGANVTGAVSYATTANSVAGANVSGQVGNATVAGTVYTNAQPNITSVGTLSSLSVTGDISSANLTITGNLIVGGTTTSVNSTVTRIVDPIFELGGGANGAALSADDNKDRGLLMHYHTGTTVRDAFIGWDDSNSEFGVGSNVTLTSEVVTWNSYGNLRANFILGNGYYLTGIDQLAAGSADVANSIANGTSNINTPVSGGNITVSIGGTSNRVIFTSTGVNIAGYANLGSGNLTTTGNVVAGYIIGNGSSLTNLTGANVSGQVGNALVASTVYTNAQPNITSVGTLSSLTVTGNINSGNANLGNLVIANFFSGSGNNLSNIQSANISGQVANALIASTVYTNAQPNITSVGTLSSLEVTGNITSGNANLGNAVTANYFVGSGTFVTGVAAVTASTVTTNAQPNITSVGTLANLIIGNATSNTTFGNGTITATGNISFTGANVSLGDASNLKITGGTAGYFITTDGAGNLSWGAAVGGGGVGATGSNTQIQFNDGGVLGASANLVFSKTTNTFTTGRVVASAGANLGNNVSNLYIGGGGASQILSTDGSGNLSWIAQPTAVITVDNFTGNGVQTVFTLSTTPASINQTVVNYNGAFQLRNAYSLTGPDITFSEAPANGSYIEVTTTMGATSGAGAFVTRTYTGNGVATTFTVTSGVTVSSVLVTENGLVQTPTVDYTISGSTLTFIVAPANGITIQIRELAISIATTNAPVYRAYTGNGVANTFTITSGLTANSLIVAENGVIQRPTTDYSVSGSNVVFVSPPASNVDIQIRELSLNGGGSSGGISLPTQGGNSGKYLTTDGATASWANVGGSLTIKDEGSNLTTAVASIDFVGAGVTASNTGNAVTVTVPTGTTRAQAMTMGIIFGG